MTPEMKTKWVAALRGRKYKQGRQLLKHAGRHCCLGVLCEVAGEKVERGQAHLGEPFKERIGLLWKDEQTLMLMNDSSKKTFAEIADYIEANVRPLPQPSGSVE